MNNTYSITRRIVVIILAAEVFAATVFSVLAFVHEARAQQRALDIAIQGRADSLVGAVQDLEDAEDHVFVDPQEVRLPAEDRWRVFNADRTPVSPANAASGTLLELQAEDGFRDKAVAGVRFRVLQYHALRIIDREETHGVGIKRPVILVYATPATNLLQESLRSARFYIVTAVLISALTAAAVAFILRVSLRPVNELAHAAEQLSITSLYFSVPQSARNIAELQPLALALTTVVERLRGAFEREKQFAGDAAHELKTAVAVLRSTIQVLMLRNRTAEEYQAGLQRALEDTQRLESIVLQMLDLARAEETHMIEPGTTVLAIPVEKAIQELRPLALKSDVHLLSEIDTSAVVSMTQDQAEVLVRNLLSNAIQHSHAKSNVRVLVEGVKDRVLLTIEDEGEGITAEALPHIFERFYRADPSRSRATGGTGLGLAICRSIVEQAGGTIKITSQVGLGTVVTVAFIAP